MAKLTQEQLLEIFNALKKEVKPYEKGAIRARIDIEGKYDLWSERPGVNVNNKLKGAVSFTTLILQSSYVGFYYMPIYTNCEAVKNRLSPEFMKHLKGKACFHIKSIDDDLLKDVRDAMKVGYEAFKKNGWV